MSLSMFCVSSYLLCLHVMTRSKLGNYCECTTCMICNEAKMCPFCQKVENLCNAPSKKLSLSKCFVNSNIWRIRIFLAPVHSRRVPMSRSFITFSSINYGWHTDAFHTSSPTNQPSISCCLNHWVIYVHCVSESLPAFMCISAFFFCNI